MQLNQFLVSNKIYASHGEISTVFLALGSVTHAFTGCSTKNRAAPNAPPLSTVSLKIVNLVRFES